MSQGHLGLILEQVSFNNFMAVGNKHITVDLSKTGTTFIIGENLDDGGSSGAGKTTIINAVAFALFDKVPSKISKENLLNRTNKDSKKMRMEVKLTFTVDTVRYRITRFRGHETGYLLEQQDGDTWKDLTNAAGFNTSIEELIGFSYELFKQVILFDGSSTPFLDQSASDQRALIEELLKITLLSKKAEALKKQRDNTDGEIKIQEALLKQAQLAAERHKQHVADAEARVVNWETAHEQKLQALTSELASSALIDLDAEEALHVELAAALEAFAPLRAEVQSLVTKVDSKRLDLGRFPKKTDLALTSTKLRAAEEQRTKLSKEHEHLENAKCPYCLQEYADARSKLVELNARMGELKSSVDELTALHAQLKTEEAEHVTSVQAEIDILTEELKSKRAEADALEIELSAARKGMRFKTLAEVSSFKATNSAKASQLEALKLESNPHVEALEALLEESETKLESDELNKLIKYREHQQMLFKLLTDKNSYIRKAIISKTLPFLNKRIAFYTQQLGLPHVIVFQPDLSCQITQYGRDLSHGNLSNGQKNRLNLSLCFAFRDVLTYLHTRVNVLFTDEIDGGKLDEQTVNLLIKLLKTKAWDDGVGIFIISHRPEFEGRCDRNLVVRLEGGFSTLIEQEIN